jgi:hypothetical protein
MTPRRAVYSTVQRTRPFDTEDRPAGLPVNEGFNLEGERRLGPDGSLVASPPITHWTRPQSTGDAVSA